MKRAAGVGLAVLAAALLLGPAPARGAVDCDDPQVRSALQQARSVFAQVIAQYRTLPAAARQQLDQQLRQATGYTIPQLAQLTVDCGSSAPGPTPRPTIRPLTAAPSARAPTPSPTPPPTPRVFPPSQYQFRLPAFPARTLSPARYRNPPTPRPEPAVQRARTGPLAAASLPPPPPDGVPIGSGNLKLCWQLFSRTDCSDREAVEMYKKRSQPVIERVRAEQAAADADLAKAERRSALFEEAGVKQDISRLTAALREQHADLMAARKDAIEGVVTSLAGAVPYDLPNEVSAGSMYLRDAPKLAATLGQKAASGERLEAKDYEDAANLAVGVGTDLTARVLKGTATAASATAVGRGVAAGQAVIKLVEVGYLDHQVRATDLAIREPLERLAANRALLDGQRLSATLRSQELAYQVQWRERELAAVERYAGR